MFCMFRRFEMKNICVELCDTFLRIVHVLIPIFIAILKRSIALDNIPIEYKTLECSLIAMHTHTNANTIQQQWGQSRRNAINWNHIKPFYMQIQWIPFCSKIYLNCADDIYRNKYACIPINNNNRCTSFALSQMMSSNEERNSHPI